MSLTKTNELTQIIDESMLPMEHSGGDGWSIAATMRLSLFQTEKWHQEPRVPSAIFHVTARLWIEIQF